MPSSKSTALLTVTCACTILCGAAVVMGQQSFQKPGPESGVTTSGLAIDVVDAGRNPLTGLEINAVGATGGTFKAAVMPDGTAFISGIQGQVKLFLEHPTLGSGQVSVDVGSRPLNEIMVMFDRGVATLLPAATDSDGAGSFSRPYPQPVGLSDCCVPNGTPGCDDPECEAIVCGVDPFCCDVEWDGICADEAADLCGDLCDIPPPPPLECPAEGIDEGEACGADTNGGCNSAPPAFTAASCGDTFCGTAWADGGTRDTDWYIVDVPDPDGDGIEVISGTLTSQFAGVCFIVDIAQGSCANVAVLGDIGCGDQNANIAVASDTVAAPGTYAVFVATGNCAGGGIFEGVPCGGGNNDYVLEIACAAGEPPPPFADECADAIALEVPSDTDGTNEFATFDGAPTCVVAQAGPGVWYKVVGTGTTMTASTCNQAGFDTMLSIFCGECPEGGGSDCCIANGTPGCDDPECEAIVCGVDPFCCDVAWDGICADEAEDLCGDLCGSSSLICVTGNDDAGGCANFSSEVSWCSQAGAEYLIMVHGFAGAVGEFTLSVFDNGVSCNADVQCLPAGACCICPEDICIVTTADDCAAQGGVYLGDGTNCGVTTYETEVCDSDFEDISGSGTIAPNASNSDDAGDSGIPIGFDFVFFGSSHNTIGLASNGYLTFGTTLGDFTNDPIPSAATPNDVIAPYWDDWSPNDGGDVRYQTLGTAPNRRFIAQWTNVPHFNTGATATFQAVLHEGTNCVQFRYGSPLEFESPTIGIENSDGSDGAPGGFGPAVVPGDCVGICPVSSGNPCPPCQITGSLDVKPGSCPNPVNRVSNGVIPIALVGTAEIDVSQVDIASLQLSRADGEGGSVSPIEGPPGPHTVIEDVATPFEGELCDCHTAGGDGVDDLSMKFATQAVVDALLLGDEPNGATVEVCVTGTLLDGTAFVACDCIVMVGPGSSQGVVSVSATLPEGDAFIWAAPLDDTLDGDGFANFQRSYTPGTVVTLTAGQTMSGAAFRGWSVSTPGSFSRGLLRNETITITIVEGMTTVEAIYSTP